MTETPRQLPIVRIGNKRYFKDTRLKEYRNTKNPHEKYTFEEMGIIFNFIDVGTQLMNTIAIEAKMLGAIVQGGQSMNDDDILHIVTQDGEIITVIRTFNPDEEAIREILGDEEETEAPGTG